MGLQSKRIKKTIQTLSEDVPLDLPVRVTRPKGLEEWGSCERLESPDRFLIRIGAELSEEWAVAILVHEWAHAKAWTEDALVECHGPEWGLAYSRCYQAIYGP